MSSKPFPHIALDEGGGTADCAVCSMSVTVPDKSFGPIPRTDLLASFLVQHSVHTKAGRPAGLTPTGRTSKAAVECFRDMVGGDSA